MREYLRENDEAFITAALDALPAEVIAAGTALAASSSLTGERPTYARCVAVARAYEADERLVTLLLGYLKCKNHRRAVIDILLPHRQLSQRALESEAHLPRDLPGLAALALAKAALPSN